ncbi:hypothetical protein EDD85DRAFT_953393 [Armillaria nabsnona]|nr:hypothetical protein EDD85DRAFT_953393 [Armillaria nabsnona]
MRLSATWVVVFLVSLFYALLGYWELTLSIFVQLLVPHTRCVVAFFSIPVFIASGSVAVILPLACHIALGCVLLVCYLHIVIALLIERTGTADAIARP